MVTNETGFCFRGGAGIGKTHLAVAVSKMYFDPEDANTIATTGQDERINYRDAFIFETAPNLMSEIKGTFGNNSKETEKSVVDRYSDVKLLVLDDLGSEKESEYSIMAIYAILSNRINWMRPTIITTNKTLSELGKWSERIASRLSAFETLKLPEIDRRVLK